MSKRTHEELVNMYRPDVRDHPLAIASAMHEELGHVTKQRVKQILDASDDSE